MKGIDIVNQARTWVDTPYHHQARVKGHGVDCAQLIIGVGQELNLVPEYPKIYMSYGRVPRPDFMRARLAEFMDEIKPSEAKIGDVFWMGWRKSAPMHLGIFSDLHGGGVIHAYSKAGKVIETRLDSEFKKMIDSWWRYRGVN